MLRITCEWGFLASKCSTWHIQLQNAGNGKDTAPDQQWKKFDPLWETVLARSSFWWDHSITKGIAQSNNDEVWWGRCPIISKRIHFIKPPGWWFGTCFIFPYIGNNNPNWRTHIFQSGGPTTNQPQVSIHFMMINSHPMAPEECGAIHRQGMATSMVMSCWGPYGWEVLWCRTQGTRDWHVDL